ncbi:MAG: reverse transcriptase/maturase family protein [Candidatus Staskawiczbacteria bacterium]|nr:reverse transcriptase/maturase family protein [Candidatus Staskawiczbacteria bacterium]
MKIYKNLFNEIISAENLFSAWDKFKNGKRNKRDVQLFEWNLEENIFKLQRDLKNKMYKHGDYHSFNIKDPKPRNIHKAQVRDRILHHAVFKILNPIFEAGFCSASFSCRVGYGTHKGVEYLQNILRKASKNGEVPCFALKCDIKKFFDTMDHNVLLNILKRKIKDDDTAWLLDNIISSFFSNYSVLGINKGVPIGNLTSQLFANIYLNELDKFMKQKLKVKYYIRYTDDFLVISGGKEYLENIIPRIADFLEDNLLLKIHGEKTKIQKTCQGVDFLGYVVFQKYKLVRTKTKKRIMKKFEARMHRYNQGFISKNSLLQSLQSYLGFLSHAKTYKIQCYFKNRFWFWLNE